MWTLYVTTLIPLYVVRLAFLTETCSSLGDSNAHFSPQLHEDFERLYQEQMRGVDDPHAARAGRDRRG